MEFNSNEFYKLNELLDIATLTTLRKWINTRELKASKVGRRYLVRGADIIRFIEGRAKSTTKKTTRKKAGK
jgi:excisionase family DNA binding protein